MTRDYQHQVHCLADEIDLDFWRKPEAAQVPDDELDFLYIPDAVESMALFEVSKEVHSYQREHLATGDAITRALIVTMGGMLPGVLLHDHLVDGREPDAPKIEFGTVGVSLYKGIGERYDKPRVQHGMSISVSGETVLVVDDLGDRGGTLEFLNKIILDDGAARVLNLVMYMKPAAMELCPADFWFGETAQDTWIVTPRERVELIIKRVPLWRERGADERECYRRLVELIGFDPALVNYYLPRAFRES